MNNNHNYNNKLQWNANELRKEMAKSATCLWKFVLRNRHMLGCQFRRQAVIANYVVDFVCFPLRLIIEIDGATHDNETQYNYNKERDGNLRELNFITLRIADYNVFNKINDNSNPIQNWIEEYAQVPLPSTRHRRK